jgi:Rieske Fe-S protein
MSESVLMDRRRFVRLCACAAGASAATGLLTMSACASIAVRPVTPVNGRVQLALAQYPELTEAGGSLRIRPEGAEDPIYVLAVGDRTFAALSPICTHLGCTVDIQGDRLVCPCHGSTYDRQGIVLRGPAERALRRYPVNVTGDGTVVIDVRTS